MSMCKIRLVCSISRTFFKPSDLFGTIATILCFVVSRFFRWNRKTRCWTIEPKEVYLSFPSVSGTFFDRAEHFWTIGTIVWLVELLNQKKYICHLFLYSISETFLNVTVWVVSFGIVFGMQIWSVSSTELVPSSKLLFMGSVRIIKLDK